MDQNPGSRMGGVIQSQASQPLVLVVLKSQFSIE
jgi:hypothetical protein